VAVLASCMASLARLGMRTGRVACALCGLIACDGSGDVRTDGRPTIDDATRDVRVPACDVSKSFGTPLLVDGVNSGDHEKFGWLTGDQLTIYFGRSQTASGGYDLYVANRAQLDAAFGDPTALQTVNTIYSESRPIVSGDGLTLYMEYVDSAGIAIHFAVRSDLNAAFSAQMVVPVIDTTAAEFNPWISEDGLTLYFTSNRDGYNDIFISTRPSTTADFTKPVAVAELNSSGGDYMGALSSDGLEIFFGSSRDTNLGNDDIFHATRSTPSGAFGAPTKIMELSDASTDEYPTWLSADRCHLMFTSNRGGGYDVWLATRPQ
jgi:hypothetical protein